MIATIGVGVLVIALVISVMALATAIYGVRSKSGATLASARLSALVVFPLISLVVLALVILLLTNHFEYVYVFQHIDLAMPVYLRIAALWGGQEGSLLFWCWLLSGFTFAALVRKWNTDRDLQPWVIAVTSFTLVFFLFLVVFFENPFHRYFISYEGEVIKSLFTPIYAIQAQPQDGLGLNPLLRHIGMVVHPPALYIGFVGFVIPFAYAISALIQGRTDSAWVKATRKWSLFAWLFLSIGLVLGSRWAYDVLGWGGYWGWDPVEISAFMPWLTGTAYLHSMLMQEKRGVFKRLNITLIILTFCLVIFGTFLTRSGMLSSVHAFSQSVIGPSFFVFICLTFLLSLGLLLYRWNILSTEFQVQSFFSRESLFLFNNLLFIAIFLICLTGILFPIFSELMTGQKVTVGPPFYESATGPLFGLLLLLMGIVPLSAWGASSSKSLGREIWKPALISLVFPLVAFVTGAGKPLAILALWLTSLPVCITLYDYSKSVAVSTLLHKESRLKALFHLTSSNRHRYGGYIVHLGVALMGFGIIGIEFLQSQTQATLKQGESVDIAGYSLTYQNLDVNDTGDGREEARASLKVSHNDRAVGWVFPRRDYYYASEQTVTIPGLRSTPVEDLYVILVDWLPITSEGATFKVFVNPLVVWLWVGPLVLVTGTLVALWPSRKKGTSLVIRTEEGK